MKLFIIGNGFDRGHDLRTTYWDFRTFLEDEHWQFLMSFEENYSLYPADTSAPYYREDVHKQSRGNLLWYELETNLANIDLDHIVDNADHMDLGLENEYDIIDTLDHYNASQYQYIEQLAIHLDEWVKTINLDNVRRRTTLISQNDEAIYITFNYTEVLEKVYQIDPYEVIHIHGSIREDDIEPVLGHGNLEIIDRMRDERHEAEGHQNEKAMSIRRAMEDYFRKTYKDIREYMLELSRLHGEDIDEIIVIGHSLSGVDIPYFKEIDHRTSKKASWIVHYFSPAEEKRMRESLLKCEIDKERIVMIQSNEFYDLP
ncbi:abortive infection AbiH-like protein [Paenibacillus taihuensis]|uniref:Abortive infection AbiH-like protein n=1 Tax=Paenibacillus taihuensis TaxID=1156355 RepID=A0A3D9RX39_9BACL|nr:bacteriophage abortive infection AbiH family protein [Paenibacillus taihuensis]REE84549.1 abortive infection AbiH-like protein [Paenibacillus taihuensis]